MKVRPELGFIATSLELNGQAPNELLLFPFGEWKGFTNAGGFGAPRTISMNEAKGKQAIAYAERQKQHNPKKQWPIDYEHQSISGGEAPAAAWYSGLKLGSNGVLATGVEWTPRAKKMVEDGEYKYYSPWWHDEDVLGRPYLDKHTGEKVPIAIFGAGLTNNPFIDEIPALVSTGNSHQLYIFNSTHIQEGTMNKALQSLIAFLSLAATATEEELVAKVNTFYEQLRALGIVAKEGTVLTAQAVLDHLTPVFTEVKTLRSNYAAIAKALGAVETDPVEKLTALIASANDKTGMVAKADFDALQAKFTEREVDELIAAAMAKGKISPATRDTFRALALKDRQSFTDLMAKTADYSAVPLQKIDASSQVPTDGALTETEILVAKALGNDPKKVQETKKLLELAAKN